MPTLSVLATHTTGANAAVDGTLNLPAFLTNPSTLAIQLAFDITNHTSSSPFSVTASFDVSMDGGVSWNIDPVLGTPINAPNWGSVGRDKGYDGGGVCHLTHPLLSDGAGNLNRMVRASLVTTGSVITSLQVMELG